MRKVNSKCLNLKCVKSVGQLHFGIKRLFSIVSLIVFSLTDLHCTRFYTKCLTASPLCCREYNLIHLPLAIPSEACRIRSNGKLRTKEIIYANDDCFTVYYFHKGIVPSCEICIHQSTDFRNRKTNAITTPISNFGFVFLYLSEETDRICEIIVSEFVRLLLNQITTVGSRAKGQCLH